MPKILYIEKNFSKSSTAIIEQANDIIEEYEEQGYDLTLRQLYYQFVSRDILANKQTEYKRLGSIINDARLAGMIDWDTIEDRTRSINRNPHWDGPRDVVESCVHYFQIDKWANQEHRVEVWIEKDALLGVIEKVCGSMDVTYFSCRGYTSQSAMWRAGRRFEQYAEAGQEPIIIHLGDHDPSGIDMTRDIDDRLATFMGGLQVKRVALTMDQIEEYDPPPNPAKLTDSRAKGYVDRFGYNSWELDALEPRVMEELIRDTIMEFRDEEKWNESVELEEEHKQALADAAKKL